MKIDTLEVNKFNEMVLQKRFTSGWLYKGKLTGYVAYVIDKGYIKAATHSRSEKKAIADINKIWGPPQEMK